MNETHKDEKSKQRNKKNEKERKNQRRTSPEETITREIYTYIEKWSRKNVQRLNH